MKILKFINSVFFLGILFAFHLLKYIFTRRTNSAEFIKRFEKDNIKRLGGEEIALLYNASECVL